MVKERRKQNFIDGIPFVKKAAVELKSLSIIDMDTARTTHRADKKIIIENKNVQRSYRLLNVNNFCFQFLRVWIFCNI